MGGCSVFSGLDTAPQRVAEGRVSPCGPTPTAPLLYHHYSLLTDNHISWLEKPTLLVAVHT